MRWCIMGLMVDVYKSAFTATTLRLQRDPGLPEASGAVTHVEWGLNLDFICSLYAVFLFLSLALSFSFII